MEMKHMSGPTIAKKGQEEHNYTTVCELEYNFIYSFIYIIIINGNMLNVSQFSWYLITFLHFSQHRGQGCFLTLTYVTKSVLRHLERKVLVAEGEVIHERNKLNNSVLRMSDFHNSKRKLEYV